MEFYLPVILLTMDIMVSQFLSGGYSYNIDNLTLFIATQLLRENFLRWDMKLNKIKGSISWFVSAETANK
jgi:hypothetical protein